MGTFKGFAKRDLEFFANMPSEDKSPEHHVAYYQKNRDTARNIDNEFKSLFKDIDFFLRANHDSVYKWKAKRLSQGFGKRYRSIWGAFFSSKRKHHQEDIQLFMNFGLFEEDDKEGILEFNVGLSLCNFADDEVYKLYKNGLKSNSAKIKSILEKSQNKYKFCDKDWQPLNKGMGDFPQWNDLPGSIWISLQNEKEILDSTKLIEKIKLVMNDLYPIFHLLIRNEENHENVNKGKKI